MSYASIDAPLLLASERLDLVRQDLFYVDTNILGPVRRRETWAQIHGSAYVHIAAVLEVTVKESLRALIDEINAASCAHVDLRQSLFALVAAPQFDSIRSSSKTAMTKRLAVLALPHSTDPCILNNAVLPLDGRTLRPYHFTDIWSVFQLPGDPLPHPRHGLALVNIADARNDVAHGEFTAQEVAKRQPVSQTLKLLERAEEILVHLHTALTDYLDLRTYLR